MTRFIQTLLFIFISTLITYGQSENEAIPIVAYWQKGDVYTYSIDKIKKQWNNGELQKDEIVSYIARMEVMDSTENSYRIKWTYDGTLSGFNLPEELLKRFEKYKATDIICITDELGGFVEIENWKEYSEMMQSLYVEILEYSEEDEATKAAIEENMKPLLTSLSSKEAVEQLVFMELQFFYFLFGFEFEADKSLTYQDRLPNFLGGEPLRGDVEIKVDSVDFDAAFCVINKTMEINSDDMKGMLKLIFDSMPNKGGITGFDEFLKEAIFTVDDNHRFELYFYPGIPTYIETQRISHIKVEEEEMKRLDMIKIELLTE